MLVIRCVSCGGKFLKRPQIFDQRFCSKAKCQKERKRRWQSSKRKRDPDYRDNQARSHKTWVKNNPGYWRKYRQANEKYAARNRFLQKARNQSNKKNLCLEVAPRPGCPLPSGFYRFRSVSFEQIAKMDVCKVEIRLISSI
jgi:hypothetical protein